MHHSKGVNQLKAPSAFFFSFFPRYAADIVGEIERNEILAFHF